MQGGQLALAYLDEQINRCVDGPNLLHAGGSPDDKALYPHISTSQTRLEMLDDAIRVSQAARCMGWVVHDADEGAAGLDLSVLRDLEAAADALLPGQHQILLRPLCPKVWLAECPVNQQTMSTWQQETVIPTEYCMRS